MFKSFASSTTTNHTFSTSPYRPPTTPKRIVIPEISEVVPTSTILSSAHSDDSITPTASTSAAIPPPAVASSQTLVRSESRTSIFLRSRSGSVRSRRKSWDDLRAPLELLAASGPAPVADSTSSVGSVPEESEAEKERQRLQKIRYPFLGSSQLLRRCSSVGSLDDLDADNSGDQDSGDDFSSEDEAFKGPRRPPSLTSLNSQRSSKYRIRIEDQSNRPTNAFASDAWIRGFCAVGERSSGYVVFLCEVQTKEGPIIRASKRFSEFVRLRTDLIKTFPKFKSIIPRLPPKSSLAKFRPSFLERRRKHLSFWLATILLHAEMGGSGIVRAWILEK